MTISHALELVAPRREIAPPARRVSQDEAAARRLLAAHGEPPPEERFALADDLDADRRRDALATTLMDAFRRTGDAAVFEQLVSLVQRRLQRRIGARLRALGLGLDPEEVLQDSLVNVYRYPDRFDAGRPGAFRAWSSTIVDNVIRRQLRKARSGPELQLRTDEQLSQECDPRVGEPSARAEHGEEYAATCRAFALLLGWYLDAYHGLSERERFVLQMVEVKGLRYAEIAKVLRIRPEALKMVVFRARKRIHERLTVMFSRANTGEGGMHENGRRSERASARAR